MDSQRPLPLRPVEWIDGRVRLIDQTALPEHLVTVDYVDWREVVDAIQTMVVRGAPAIGCAAALGMALGAQSVSVDSGAVLVEQLETVATAFRASRPTAVNLFWAVDRMMAVARRCPGGAVAVREAMLQEALRIVEDDVRTNETLGRLGADLLPDGAGILTHCNAGALATAGYGTALGVIRAAHEQGKRIHVFADETRPRLQGMKLTAWELHRDGVPVTIITDSMAAVLMRQGRIQCAVVGADRIASNGDTANKIGTYGAAVSSHFHGVPFYVAAPISTIDATLADGSGIPIEDRSSREVTHIGSVRLAPEGVAAWNPSFDVTPSSLIAAIITERGVLRAPYGPAIAAALADGSDGSSQTA